MLFLKGSEVNLKTLQNQTQTTLVAVVSQLIQLFKINKKTQVSK